MSNKVKSGFLYSEPSFLSGGARAFDLFGLYDQYNQSTSPEEADTRAIASDWIIVGQDLESAMEELDEAA
jgi:hypothetical protein